METIKANILKAISEEYKAGRYYDFISNCVKETELNETVETKIVHTLHNALNRWADARVSMHRALKVLINSAQSHQTNIENNYSVDAGWVTASRYEEYIVEAKKWEQEAATAAYLIGLDAKEKSSLFAKVSSLIEYK
jgi:hypothetical protein